MDFLLNEKCKSIKRYFENHKEPVGSISTKKKHFIIKWDSEAEFDKKPPYSLNGIYPSILKSKRDNDDKQFNKYISQLDVSKYEGQLLQVMARSDYLFSIANSEKVSSNKIFAKKYRVTHFFEKNESNSEQQFFSFGHAMFEEHMTFGKALYLNKEYITMTCSTYIVPLNRMLRMRMIKEIGHLRKETSTNISKPEVSLKRLIDHIFPYDFWKQIKIFGRGQLFETMIFLGITRNYSKRCMEMLHNTTIRF